MSGFRLASPWWLTLVFPLVVATLLAWRYEKRGAVLYSSLQLVAGAPVTFAQQLRRWALWWRAFGLLLVVVAIARPQAGLQHARIQREGIAIVMCLDRSGSMEALDFQWDGERVNRLTAVKNVFRDFVSGNDQLNGRPDDLIGLVPFGGFAESAVPLTLDHGVLLETLETIQIAQPTYDRRGNIINQRFYEEERATAIGDALALAVDRLQGSQAKSKVIILLSDGENTAGVVEPGEAAEAARQFGIKIYSIGVGGTGRAPFPAVDMFGRKVFVPQEVRLDEESLRALSDKTGGQYFHAEDTQALQQVYAAIDQLEKSLAEGTTYTEYRELFQWSLLPGMAIVIVDLVLRCTRLRRLD